MLLRVRWFTIGVLSSMGVLAYLVTQVKRARERLDARALARSGGRTVAAMLGRAATRISPDEPHAG
jgi:hypothetical protein